MLVSKNNGLMKEGKRDAYARSKSPQKSFVQYFRSSSNDRTKPIDTRYQSRVHHEKVNKQKTTIHKRDTALHLEIDLVMTKGQTYYSSTIRSITI